MDQATCAVGIDVSKRKLDIALLIDAKRKSKVFDNTASGHCALSQWLADRGAAQEHTHVCLEATGPYSEAVAIALAGECGQSGAHQRFRAR
jgi:transposase